MRPLPKELDPAATLRVELDACTMANQRLHVRAGKLREAIERMLHEITGDSCWTAERWCEAVEEAMAIARAALKQTEPG